MSLDGLHTCVLKSLVIQMTELVVSCVFMDVSFSFRMVATCFRRDMLIVLSFFLLSHLNIKRCLSFNVLNTCLSLVACGGHNDSEMG